MSKKLSLPVVLLTAACAIPAHAQYKTIFPTKVPADRLQESPFRYNGVVISGDARGSGFHAWHKNTVFSAAHVVFDEENGWLPPPLWYPRVNADKLDDIKPVPTRGYARWASYATYATNDFMPSAFAKDVVVLYRLQPIAKGKPASINLNGFNDLRAGKTFTITGYPAENFYLDTDTTAFRLFRTKPFRSPFQIHDQRAIYTTLITTGAGNSGGPVWTKNQRGEWTASGVLVGGRPSETVVYPFSSDMNALLRSVQPIVSSPQGNSQRIGDVENTSMFFTYSRPKVIPDGVHQWTNFHLGVSASQLGKTITSLKLNLDIKTPHRGDLFVILTSPEGISHIIHNEEGANGRNLIIRGRDLSEVFADMIADGTWTLKVQDRLKGDTCEFRSFRLEIGTDEFGEASSEEP